MLANCDGTLAGETGTLLGRMDGELRLPPYYYHADELARMAGMSPPKRTWLLESLRDAGFDASGVHYDPKGIKTDAGLPELGEIFNNA